MAIDKIFNYITETDNPQHFDLFRSEDIKSPDEFEDLDFMRTYEMTEISEDWATKIDLSTPHMSQQELEDLVMGVAFPAGGVGGTIKTGLKVGAQFVQFANPKRVKEFIKTIRQQRIDFHNQFNDEMKSVAPKLQDELLSLIKQKTDDIINKQVKPGLQRASRLGEQSQFHKFRIKGDTGEDVAKMFTPDQINRLSSEEIMKLSPTIKDYVWKWTNNFTSRLPIGSRLFNRDSYVPHSLPNHKYAKKIFNQLNFKVKQYDLYEKRAVEQFKNKLLKEGDVIKEYIKVDKSGIPIRNKYGNFKIDFDATTKAHAKNVKELQKDIDELRKMWKHSTDPLNF